MSVDMVDIYFSVPRDLLRTLKQSDESKHVFFRCMENVLHRISNIQDALNLKKVVFHTPSMIINTDCAICLEPISLFSTITMLPCRHGFHPSCVKTLTDNNHYSCPVCRSPM